MSIDPKSSYYDIGGIETVEVIRAKLTKEQYEGWCLGNIIKYALRAYHKKASQTSRDIEKICIYSDWLKESRMRTKLNK